MSRLVEVESSES